MPRRLDLSPAYGVVPWASLTRRLSVVKGSKGRLRRKPHSKAIYLTWPPQCPIVPRMATDTAPASVQATVILPSETYEQLKDLARRENRTIAGQLRHAIERMLAASAEESA